MLKSLRKKTNTGRKNFSNPCVIKYDVQRGICVCVCVCVTKQFLHKHNYRYYLLELELCFALPEYGEIQWRTFYQQMIPLKPKLPLMILVIVQGTVYADV